MPASKQTFPEDVYGSYGDSNRVLACQDQHPIRDKRVHSVRAPAINKSDLKSEDESPSRVKMDNSV